MKSGAGEYLGSFMWGGCEIAAAADGFEGRRYDVGAGENEWLLSMVKGGGGEQQEQEKKFG